MPRGIFAGQVAAGPFYTATQPGKVPFQAGLVNEPNPPFTSTVSTVVGDNINRAAGGPWNSATTVGPMQQAFGQLPVNHPPYSSKVVPSKVVSQPGLSETANPDRLNEINGSPPANTGLLGKTPTAAFYTATEPK